MSGQLDDREALCQLWELAPMAIVALDAAAHIVGWNRAAELAFGYSRQRALGMAVAELLPGQVEAARAQVLASLLHPQDELPIEAMLRRHSGECFYAQIVCKPLRDSKGGSPCTIAYIQDISQRKSLEQQVLQSQKMEAVGLLAGGVAHDFNNLLTAINGYSDLLLRTLSPGTSPHSMAQEIHLAGMRATRLTRQLLAFSRKQVLAPVVLSLSRVVADMARLLGRLVGEDVVLHTSLADALWPCRADLGQLEQVVMNLVVNARDAMPQGGQLALSTTNITVRDGEAQAELPAGEYVCLTVTDSGCGMDAATRQRMFEPFFTTKDAGRGTGLGLATVYGIIKQSEGYILVDTAPGRGTSFRIFLPRTEAATSLTPTSPPRRDQPAGGEVILLVEDEVSVRTMTNRLLLRGGYVVYTAASAAEAEQLCASHKGPLHLLLTDIVMPGASGIELSARLRRQRPDLAVLYISGYAEGSLPARSALPPGATLLPKPYASEALLSRVREVLDRHGPKTRRRRSDPEL